MVTFNTIGDFILCVILIVLSTLAVTLIIESIINDKSKKETIPKANTNYHVGGIYGRKTDIDLNNPYQVVRYDIYILIIDSQPSRDNEVMYYQYVYLDSKMQPYPKYHQYNKFSDDFIGHYWETKWDYIKDIDLSEVNFCDKDT
jgi:hypothetical protein